LISAHRTRYQREVEGPLSPPLFWQPHLSCKPVARQFGECGWTRRTCPRVPPVVVAEFDRKWQNIESARVPHTDVDDLPFDWRAGVDPSNLQDVGLNVCHCLTPLATHNAVRTLAPSSLAILCEENYAGRFEGAAEATLTGTAIWRPPCNCITNIRRTEAKKDCERESNIQEACGCHGFRRSPSSYVPLP